MKGAFILMILALPVQFAAEAMAASNCGPGLAEPAPGPGLTIDITESSLEAQVTESQPGLATFHGTVTVQMPTVRGAEVTLTSSTDIGWVSQVSPTTLQLSNGQAGPFTVTVVVPQGTAASQMGNLIVNGRAVASGVQATAEATALLTVRPYYRISLDAVKRTVEIAPGGTARFSLRVTNAGNSIDSFTVQFSNQDELRKQGWSLGHTSASLEGVNPGEFHLMTISLTAPASLSPYLSRETALAVKAWSDGAREQDQNVTLDYSLVAKEVGVSGTGVGAVTIVAALIAVGVVVFWRRRRRAQAEEEQDEQPVPPEEPA